MNELYLKYLAAMRAFVQGSVPDAVSQEEWNGLAKLAHIHSAEGILCYVYMTHSELVPPEVQPQLRKLCLQSIALYAGRAEKMCNLVSCLDENGIDCIFMKGFVIRNYYPVPELRTFGDVDFVIRREDRAKCDALMKTLGYEPHENWEPVYSYRKDTEYYEVHTAVLEVDVSDKADYMEYFSHIWEHTCPSETVMLPHALEFTPEFHFLYLLTHIAKHISGSGVGVRMYLDIAFFIRHFRDTADWKQIAAELEKLCLTDFAGTVLTAVENWFGVESPLPLKPVPENVIRDFTEFTMAGGVYGYAGRDKSLIFLKQQNRSEESVSKGKTLLYHAFPPVSAMENRYTYLQKHRWLLPAAWIHRLAASRKEWSRFADHTKKILQADDEEVLRLKRLYRDIGL